MFRNGILGIILLYLSALVVTALQAKGISVEDPRLELWPADGDRGAVLYVYNVKEVNKTQLQCTVQPGNAATTLRIRENNTKYSDNDFKESYYKKTYDVDFENEGKMTCSLSESVDLVSNTLTARLLCGETFVAAFRDKDTTNIAKIVNRYNKERFRVGKVMDYFQKYQGDLTIIHFTIFNCSIPHNDISHFSPFFIYLKERNVNWVYWRNTRHCYSVAGKGFNWPLTPVGTSTVPENPCEDEDGAPVPIRKCLGGAITGAYWDEEPEIEECRKISTRAERIQNTTMDQQSIRKLVEEVQMSPLTAYEVFLVSEKLKEVEEILNNNTIDWNQVLPNVSTDVVRIVDAVLASGEEVLRKVEAMYSFVTDMVETLNHVLIASTTSVPAIRYESHLSTFTVDEKGGVRGIMSLKEDFNSPQRTIHPIFWDGDLNQVNLSRSSWGFLLMGKTGLGMTAKIYNSSSPFDEKNRAKKLISPVIGLTVFGKNKTAAGTGAAVLFLIHKDENYAEEKHSCSLWNENEGRGRWSREGCARSFDSIVPESMYGCLCTHLTQSTHFGMLVAHSYPGDTFDGQVLGVITKVGCSASFICVAIAFLCSAFNPKRFRSVYGKIELNLFFSVFLLDATQLVVMFIPFSPGGTTCIAIGVMLHYSVLATFAWMMLVGLMHMLRLSPKTLLSARNVAGNHLLLKTTVFGWGMAAIPVVATVCDGTHHYVSDFSFCYPHHLAFYTAVIFPVGLSSGINTFIFIWVSAMLLCVPGVRSQGTNWTRQKLRRIFFLIFLFCLLGLCWIFGLLIEPLSGYETAQKIFVYIFCLTAPLHGLLLFVFLVLCERSVRSKFREALSSLNRMSRRFTSRLTSTGEMKETAIFHSLDSSPTGLSVMRAELQVSETMTTAHPM